MARQLTLVQMLDLATDVYEIHRAEMFKRSGRLGDHAMFAADQLYAALCIVAERYADLDLNGVPRLVVNGRTIGATTRTRQRHVRWLCADIAERVPGTNMQAVAVLWTAFRYSIGASLQVRRIIADVVAENETIPGRVFLDDDGDDWTI